MAHCTDGQKLTNYGLLPSVILKTEKKCSIFFVIAISILTPTLKTSKLLWSLSTNTTENFGHILSTDPNTMALTHVNALQVQQTGLCAYSLQNVLLLAHTFQVCVTMEQQAPGS